MTVPGLLLACQSCNREVIVDMLSWQNSVCAFHAESCPSCAKLQHVFYKHDAIAETVLVTSLYSRRYTSCIGLDLA